MRTDIQNKQFDEERALYALEDASVDNCVFAGPRDGESALKQAHDIQLSRCDFSLRYPLWHVNSFTLSDCNMDALTRAALWYDQDGEIKNCLFGGIKALRECRRISLYGCTADSAEFGWKCSDISLTDCKITSEYLFLDSKNISINRMTMSGKYSFQYVENLEISNSQLDTKDAFWHSKNAVIKNSIVNGEYLGWYSEGLTLIDCHICGPQPLCYCKKLKLVNCTMESCDLSFEFSDVNADIKGHIDSVKNPLSGSIKAESIGSITDTLGENGSCKIITEKQGE